MTAQELIAKIRNTSPYENLDRILGKELGNLLYKLVDDSERLIGTEQTLRMESKRLNNLLGKYSDYHSLTMDGMSPEEASRECGV